ncbi:MAG: hypothetical protein LBH34_00140, partial [Prevotellaceae bacterium]|nr:hypothetical protein [Prevotellaceae bacterium]
MKIKLHIFILVLLLGIGKDIVFAQGVVPFTILFSNADTANKKLYVEIMYERPSCGNYQARFGLVTKNDTIWNVKIDSFLNNPGTYSAGGDSLLRRPTAGGYKLRFNLPSGIKSTDSVNLCVISEALPYRCVGCGPGKSDILFSATDISKACPYLGNDVLSCRYWQNRWEAWIQDPRDCNAYKIVLMPDKKWWFAQNLNYQKDLNYRKLTEGNKANTADVTGEFWCPSGVSAEVSQSIPNNSNSTNQSTNSSAISPVSCGTYGALYGWHTARALNGRTIITSANGASIPTPLGISSTTQGICPEGWLLPSDYDWGRMLNAAEGCVNPGIFSAIPCDHNPSTNVSTVSTHGSKNSVVKLKTVVSCAPHASSVDSACATYDNPAWSWRRADYTGKISQPYALGMDIYTFDLRPSGYRNYGGTAYLDMGYYTYFHSSTEYSTALSFGRSLGYSTTFRRHVMEKGNALSVRCIASASSIFHLDIQVDSLLSFTSPTKQFIATTTTPVDNNWTYTWSVTPDDGKIEFVNNGTPSAYSITANMKFTAQDSGSIYRIDLVAENVTTGRMQRASVINVVSECMITTSPSVTNVNGQNGANVTIIADPGSGYITDWYDAPAGGVLLASGSNTYTTNIPTKVYAEARHSLLPTCKSSVRTAASAVYTYTYSGSYRTVTLPPGTYRMEAYGAEGGGRRLSGNSNAGLGGLGGYAYGTLLLSGSTTFYLYLG